MKKVIAAFIAGAVCATAATAYGEEAIESLIGKQIQGQTTVYNDGQALDVAIIVDGKSYAPIRSLAEAVEKKVEFGEGEIFLATPEPAEESAELGVQAPRARADLSIEEQINQIDISIQVKQALIKVDNGLLEVNVNWSQEEKDRVIADIAKLEAEIADLQVMKTALEAQQSEGATEG